VEVWRANLATRAAAPVALIAAIGRDDFTSTLLREVTEVAPIDFCSVYDLGQEARPHVFLSASSGFDVGPDCFRRYQRGLSFRDSTFDRAKLLAVDGRLALNYLHDSEFSPAHRAAIYARHSIKERLSVVDRTETQFMALNFYRYQQRNALLPHHVDAIDASSAGLFACIHKHLEVTGRRNHLNSPQGARDALQGLCPDLTARELDTCSGLLLGLTYDGIAASMRVSLSTVKTYRARAFDKLGIHSRSALFARLQARL
jgi:DNA-binding CsgD family transcriptional regulator